MDDFTYFEFLMLLELVVREEYKYRKMIENDLRKSLYKFFRPGAFRRLNTLLELERKLNHLGCEARKKEEQEQEEENND